MKNEEIWKQRKERIKSRGSAEEFVKKTPRFEDTDESRLSYMMNRVLLGIKKFEEEKQQFFKRVEEDAHYAMSWSLDFFRAAADYRVNKSILKMFDSGLEFSEIKEQCNHEILIKARYAANKSTSQTSNLSNECELEAWARIVE